MSSQGGSYSGLMMRHIVGNSYVVRVSTDRLHLLPLPKGKDDESHETEHLKPLVQAHAAILHEMARSSSLPYSAAARSMSVSGRGFPTAQRRWRCNPPQVSTVSRFIAGATLDSVCLCDEFGDLKRAIATYRAQSR
jgi:hypothetical protein